MDSKAEARPAPSGPKKETIPLFLVRLMFGLALLTLVITTYSVLTGRAHEGQPEAAAVVKEKWVVIEGNVDGKAVTVRDTAGQVLLDLKEGGFIAVIQNGLRTERRKHGIDPLKPLRIVEYANGRLVAEDPETGWSVELYAFGADNKATFKHLLDM